MPSQADKELSSIITTGKKEEKKKRLDDDGEDIDDEVEQVEKKKVANKAPIFNKISIAVIAAGIVVGIVGGMLVGNALAESRFSAEQPSDVVSVKTKSNVYGQLQDMREDMIASLNKQIAADATESLKGSVDLAATQQTIANNSKLIQPLLEQIIKSDVKLDDINTYNAGGTLDDATKSAVQTFMSSAEGTLVVGSDGKTTVTFAGGAPKDVVKAHVEEVSAPISTLTYVGERATSNSSQYTYMVSVPVSTEAGEIHTLQFIVGVSDNKVMYVNFVGELSMTSPDALTSALNKATEKLTSSKNDGGSTSTNTTPQTKETATNDESANPSIPSYTATFKPNN